MWCGKCQQDVPAIVSSNDERLICCARCNAMLSPEPSESERPIDFQVASQADLSETIPPIDLNDWELDEQLQTVQRLVNSLKANAAASLSIADPIERLDSAHRAAPPEPMHKKIPAKPKRRSSGLAWTVLSLSLMVFACGAVLLGWSFWTGRGDLWSLGMPLAIAGQAGLIIGLILQLDGLWRSNEDTSSTLDELDGQLRDLKHATTLLGTTHSTSAQSFYLHMADGASPQMLLADLKGQMDMLAMKLADERR